MNQKPEFISQTAEIMTPDERKKWCMARVAESREKGATFHRFSFCPHGVTLHEGWKVAPQEQGEPRFQMVPLL
jgi:hypothetical protein